MVLTMYQEALMSSLEGAGSLECDENFSKRVQNRIANATGHPDVPGTRYRASSIGKPWILQVLNRWYSTGVRTFSVEQCMTMLQGVVAQEYIAELLNLMDYKFEQEITLQLGSITGHADIVVKTPTEIVVIECKAMAPHLAPGFVKSPNDDWGYMSQLSVYWWVLKQMYPDHKVSACFAIFNRGTSQLRCCPLTDAAMLRKIERVQSALADLDKLKPYDIEGLLDLNMIPPTVGGQIPGGMQRSSWSRILYTARETPNGVVYSVQDREVIARELAKFPTDKVL